jgi:uncharacterized membrane protein YadS
LNWGHLFTDKANTPLLNQTILTVQRPLDPKATDYDFGFKGQLMYGSDARGLVIANFFPRFADWLKEAVRPELYIKIAIVILGGFLAVTIAGKLSLATSVLLRGIAAIIEAYLIYWSVVYFVARKWFGFSREWAAPLASGISICGVSAAIATGAAIRSRPVVPILVSSLVVIFAVVEVLILPFLAQAFLRMNL